ncbi:hypothetical protein Tco_1039641 [Tanacetum coccineum]
MSVMEDDLFTYEVEIAEVTNIPCDLKKEDDSEQQMSHESDNDMEYDPSDVEFTESRLMGETLVLNRSLDPLYGDYIELNNLNIPLELRRDQDDDLMPTIKEGEVIEEFRARNDARMVSKIFVYPSDYDHDKNIFISCPYNLKFSCMIVLEDVDAYRDEGMGDVIFSEPLLREVKINARRFKEVTYQMVRSHPRFKCHNNEQCNKIPQLLKVSKKDKINGILHPYQKLKSFYKGVLNLGPEYV